MAFLKKTIHILGNSQDHFWFIHRNLIINQYLNKNVIFPEGKKLTILELGCGGCQISNYLSQQGHQLVVSDIFPTSFDFCNNNIYEHFIYDLEKSLPPKEHASKYDVVVMGDVLEHILYPKIVLNKTQFFLKKNGIVILTLPAMMKLWSGYDSASGHFLRYDKGTVSKLFHKSCFQISNVKYFMFLPAILLYVQRRIVFKYIGANKNYNESLEINPKFNRFMKAIMSFELFISRFLSFSFGSSLIVVGKKNK